MVACERVSSSWTRDKILTECGANPVGAVTSYAIGSDGPAPMEVNMSRKARARKGKLLARASPKARGFTTVAKAKEKNGDSGKGKGQQKGFDTRKGQQKGYMEEDNNRNRSWM